MTHYTNFVGIDIGKYEVVAACYGASQSHTFPNSPQGFLAFKRTFKTAFQTTFFVLETTGGYEDLFLQSLVLQKVAVHRANTRQVKSFIHSLGIKGKNDAIDALGLARYGFERRDLLALYQPPSARMRELQALTERLEDLKQSLVQEKNRAQAPAILPEIRKSCLKTIEFLKKEIKSLSEKADRLMAEDPDLARKRDILLEIPGIGPTISRTLPILMPELGYLGRREIASLAGLAPHPRESGLRVGYRRTGGGRQNVRRVLFMAGMAASNTKSFLGAKYQAMVAAGKKKMVALVALMRKILVIANAKIRDYLREQASLAQKGTV